MRREVHVVRTELTVAVIVTMRAMSICTVPGTMPASMRMVVSSTSDEDE